MKIDKPSLKFSDSETNPTGYFPILKIFAHRYFWKQNIKGGSCPSTSGNILQRIKITTLKQPV